MNNLTECNKPIGRKTYGLNFICIVICAYGFYINPIHQITTSAVNVTNVSIVIP